MDSAKMNTITDLWGRCVLVCILLLTLSSCQVPPSDWPQPTPTVAGPPESFPCSIFEESQWQEFGFGLDSPTDVISTVERNWTSGRLQIWSDSSDHSNRFVIWQDFGDEYDIQFSALFRKEQSLFQIHAQWYPEPTLAQVVECLGYPDYYEANYAQGVEYPMLSLAFWYLKRGIIIEQVSFHYQEQPPTIDAEYRIGRFLVVAPGEREEMVVNAYKLVDDPDLLVYGLCVLRPWPGSIEALEVESFFDNPRCELN